MPAAPGGQGCGDAGLDMNSGVPCAVAVVVGVCLAIAALYAVMLYPPVLILVLIVGIFGAAVLATLIVGWVISYFWPSRSD